MLPLVCLCDRWFVCATVGWRIRPLVVFGILDKNIVYVLQVYCYGADRKCPLKGLQNGKRGGMVRDLWGRWCTLLGGNL